MGQNSGLTYDMGYYFNVDPFDKANVSSTALQTAMADGYLHGLYMAGCYTDDFFLPKVTLIRNVRTAIDDLRRHLYDCDLGKLHARAAAYMSTDYTAPATDRLDAFITGYQIALHRAVHPRINTRNPAPPNPAMFLTGDKLRNYIYGELLAAEEQFLHTLQVGHNAYSANYAVCREDVPPDERA